MITTKTCPCRPFEELKESDSPCSHCWHAWFYHGKDGCRHFAEPAEDAMQRWIECLSPLSDEEMKVIDKWGPIVVRAMD